MKNKMNWIDINLPYRVTTFQCDLYPEYPYGDLEKSMMDKFGYTLTSINDDLAEYEKTHNLNKDLYVEDFEYSYQPLVDLDLEEISGEEYDKKYKDICDLITDEHYRYFVEFNDKYQILAEFKENSPIDKNYYESCAVAFNEFNKNNPSFEISEYNRPGVLIEVQEQDEIKRYLIGDINIKGSIESSDLEETDNTFVLRCAVLIDKSVINE